MWSIRGGPGSAAYRMYDVLRGGVNRALSRFLLAGLAHPGGARLRTLEAGSGPGFCSSLLAARGDVIRATILDIDHDALDLARARADGVRPVQGDLDGARAEMVRVTRPGGRIFVGVPYKYGLFLPFNLVPPRHPVSVWMGRLHSRRDLSRACRREDLVESAWFFYFFRGFVGVLLRKA
jgi:hypothetical protein